MEHVGFSFAVGLFSLEVLMILPGVECCHADIWEALSFIDADDLLAAEHAVNPRHPCKRRGRGRSGASSADTDISVFV